MTRAGLWSVLTVKIQFYPLVFFVGFFCFSESCSITLVALLTISGTLLLIRSGTTDLGICSELPEQSVTLWRSCTSSPWVFIVYLLLPIWWTSCCVFAVTSDRATDGTGKDNGQCCVTYCINSSGCFSRELFAVSVQHWYLKRVKTITKYFKMYWLSHRAL